MRQRGSERVWQQMGVGVQVTLVTGFLGSGKTTLINHVLKHADQSVAVVENEVHTHAQWPLSALLEQPTSSSTFNGQ